MCTFRSAEKAKITCVSLADKQTCDFMVVTVKSAAKAIDDRHLFHSVVGGWLDIGRPAVEI